MAVLLMAVGGIWAVIGAGNLIGMPWTSSSEGVLTFGLIVNVLLFIIPGLILFGIGKSIQRRHATASNTVSVAEKNEIPKVSIEERISGLKNLKDRGMISEMEYEETRKQILREI